MDTAKIAANIIYIIFISMSLIYFYLFRRNKTFVHLYCSLIPTFVSIYLLMNHHYYQPSQASRMIRILLIGSLTAFAAYWGIYSLVRRKD